MKIVLLKNRRLIAEVMQALVAGLSLALSFLLRFDFSLAPSYAHMLLQALPLMMGAKLLLFRAFGLRHLGWRYIGFPDLMRIGAAQAAASGATAMVVRLVIGPAFPRSLYVLDFLVCLTFTVGVRTAVKWLLERRGLVPHKPERRVLIYGAGKTGVATLAEIRTHPGIGCRVIGFVDDDLLKRSMRIHGLRVLGGRMDLPEVARRYRIEEILLALPEASGDQITGILEQCRAGRIAVRRVPALFERIGPRVLGARVQVDQIRDVRLEDLLGRPPARWDQGRLDAHLSGRAVLVTGAGGSIGSELCRQIARHQPRVLIGFDQAETALYQIEQELRESFPDLAFYPAVGSVQNRRRIEEVFEEHQPESVYHAAAYKHVPLMEAHPFEAVENNVFGTRNLARAAAGYGAQEFVLVSSDKAVRPAGVMGATKRVAEMICQAERSGTTRFRAVRFGNVLGSSGSVIPNFRRQIETGGPVTVTHPDMRRYFMTISEAAELVLQASAMGSGGEIFVLDMGEPVRILDLARKMVLLSGFRPDIDIPIVFSGMRPGEKLFEELRTLEENTASTPHAQIRVFSGLAPQPEAIRRALDDLKRAVEERAAARVVSLLQQMVPDYTPSMAVLRSQPRREAVGA
jgi:FlaA1/EpsC-like NDP-sugar epimerase